VLRVPRSEGRAVAYDEKHPDRFSVRRRRRASLLRLGKGEVRPTLFRRPRNVTRKLRGQAPRGYGSAARRPLRLTEQHAGTVTEPSDVMTARSILAARSITVERGESFRPHDNRGRLHLMLSRR